MSDWLAELPDDERARWDEFVEHFRRDALEKISDSAAFVSLLPNCEGDVKFWAELGCAVMLDKPILAVVAPGARVPGKLRDIAYAVVEADVDTGQGQAAIAAAVRDLLGAA